MQIKEREMVANEDSQERSAKENIGETQRSLSTLSISIYPKVDRNYQ